MAAGDNSSVAITPGTGVNVDSFSQASGDQRQAVVIGDKTQTDTASVFGAGFLRTSDEPVQVFYDPFDAAPDTVNVWTVANAGGGTAPAVTTGTLTVGSGTTTAGYSQVTSIPTFKPTVPAWVGYSFALSMTDLAAPTANTYRFWGAGTSPASPTVAAPLTNAIGFELGIDGKMYAVVYAGGTRTAIQDLSAATGNAKQPTDTSIHRYGVYYRTDRSYFFIDTLDNVVATTAFQSPQVQTLPVKLLAVAGTTPASSGILSCTGLAVWDTGKNATNLSDGTYPWRKVAVTASGELTTSDPDTTSAGTITALNGAVSISTNGQAVTGIQVTGTWAATLIFEATTDGTNYFTVNGVASVTGAQVGTATANGQWRINSAGYSVVRVRASAFTSGTATVSMIANSASSLITLAEPLPAGTNTVGALHPTPAYTIGTATGTAAATTGQIGRVVRATANVAQTTAATLIAAPAAGTRLYVTNITCTNEGATLTVLRLFAGTLPSAAGAVAVTNDVFDFAIAASGGGAGLNFPPNAPWALPTATALSFAVTVATTWDVSVSYYVAA